MGAITGVVVAAWAIYWQVSEREEPTPVVLTQFFDIDHPRRVSGAAVYDLSAEVQNVGDRPARGCHVLWQVVSRELLPLRYLPVGERAPDNALTTTLDLGQSLDTTYKVTLLDTDYMPPGSDEVPAAVRLEVWTECGVGSYTGVSTFFDLGVAEPYVKPRSDVRRPNPVPLTQRPQPLWGNAPRDSCPAAASQSCELDPVEDAPPVG